MPRSGRGGQRKGQIGKAYAQRTDLHTLPTSQTVPGQPYGAQTAQQNAMRAVPMANGPMNGPGAGAPVSAPPASQPVSPQPPVAAGSPALQGLLDGTGGLPPGIPAPGSLPPLNAPTGRPDEHLMTGVNAGPGPGSEALSPMVIHPLVAAAGTLNALADNPSPLVKTLRDVLNAQLGNQGAL